MLFTPVIALAGLAAAAPQGLVYRHATNETVPAYKPVPRSINNINGTVPAYKKFSRSIHNVNGTFPVGTKSSSSTESVEVSDFSVQEKLQGLGPNVESIASVYFQINGNISCSADNPGAVGTVFGCGETDYSFGLLNGTTSKYSLRLYHQTGVAVGRTGQGDIPTVPHAGGSSADGSYEINNQIGTTAIVISSS
ncbi:hypothetical protein N8I77_009456 [Diaporthe amygdali]|uniref:AA1-like domain-containing protein n=1 Tax=Phomopsis amygdali TaxID=1214568 RepID=A0AAD9W365_PHOAM|nr:hypothetical protein N8I77_009456 [Diaporthe amygdali]